MLSRIDALVVLGLVVGRLRGTARAQSIPLALQLVAALLGLLDDVRCDDPDLFEVRRGAPTIAAVGLVDVVAPRFQYTMHGNRQAAPATF